VSGALLLAALLLTYQRGSGQTPAPAPRLVQRSGLGAVVRDSQLIHTSRRPSTRAASPVVDRPRVLDRTGRSGARYEAGRIFVKFRASMSEGARRQAVQQAARSAVIAARPRNADFDDVRVDPNEDAEAIAAALSRRPDVEYAQVPYRVQTYFAPNDPSYASLQWNFQQIDLARAWDIQAGASSSVIVAVLDTGAAFDDAIIRFRAFSFSKNGVSYPALGTIDVPFARATDLAAAGSTGDSRFADAFDFIWDDTDPFDLDGHGTHVTGTLGQLTNNGLGVAGIAFNARLMPLKVVSGDWDDIFSSPNEGSDFTVAQGLKYAADHGAKVINMSIGRTGIAGDAPMVEDALRYAVSKGAFVAIAGGNDAPATPVEVYAEAASRIDGVVSVAAVNLNRQRASYSTTGSWIELAAPGGDIAQGTAGVVWQQTYDFDFTDTFLLPPAQYKAPRFDVLALIGEAGTSMATPHVSGLAALMVQQGFKSPAAIEAAMKRFATDLGSSGRDNEFGFGEVNARATLRGLGLAR
jgi:serine protease